MKKLFFLIIFINVFSNNIASEATSTSDPFNNITTQTYLRDYPELKDLLNELKINKSNLIKFDAGYGTSYQSIFVYYKKDGQETRTHFGKKYFFIKSFKVEKVESKKEEEIGIVKEVSLDDLEDFDTDEELLKNAGINQKDIIKIERCYGTARQKVIIYFKKDDVNYIAEFEKRYTIL